MPPALSVRTALRWGRRRRGRGIRGPARWGAAVLGALVVVGCKSGPVTPVSVPPAAAYDAPSSFAGQWLGEVDGEVGTLTIEPLGPGRYRGLYEGEAVEIDYVLSLTQDMVAVGEQEIAANRALFDWQDGRGGRGEGWLLINREDSALTGAFGERGQLDRPWTFIRVE